MTRTTIVLPEEIKSIAVKNAQAAGISFGEFVRRSLEMAIKKGHDEHKSHSRGHDSLFAGMRKLKGTAKPGIRDGASHHDEYLYGRKPESHSSRDADR